jgi:hypothetical protein
VTSRKCLRCQIQRRIYTDRELGFLTSVAGSGYQGGNEVEPNSVGNDDDDADSEEHREETGYEAEEELDQLNRYVYQAEIKAARRVRPVFMKTSTQRLLSMGDLRKCEDFSRYLHDIGVLGKNGEEIILCHYVDDLIVGTNNLELREKLMSHIREKWAVTDEGEMSRFVGLNFARKANGRS